MKDYFNTNGESGDTLTASQVKAQNQQEAILGYFRDMPRLASAPHEVQAAFGNVWPLTSVRRAITNLTDAGLIAKTPAMRRGTYGKFVHTWQLVTD